ncbi:hypothetical protein GCM10028789_09950 [Sinomonas halotolerans]
MPVTRAGGEAFGYSNEYVLRGRWKSEPAVTVRDPSRCLGSAAVEPVEFRHRQSESGWEKHVQSAVRRSACRFCRNPGAAAVKGRMVAMDFMQWLSSVRVPQEGTP